MKLYRIDTLHNGIRRDKRFLVYAGSPRLALKKVARQLRSGEQVRKCYELC